MRIGDELKHNGVLHCAVGVDDSKEKVSLAKSGHEKRGTTLTSTHAEASQKLNQFPEDMKQDL